MELKFLTPGRTPWSFEEEGTEQSKYENYDIISTALSPNPPDSTIIFNTNCICEIILRINSKTSPFILGIND